MKTNCFIFLLFIFFYSANFFSQVNIKTNSIATAGTSNQIPSFGPTDPDTIDQIPTIADRVRFLYDVSGNQMERFICINCTTNRPVVSNNETGHELSKEFFEIDDLKFYPNPVEQYLQIDFNSISKNIANVSVYNLSGQLLNKYDNLNNQSTITIPFINLSQGMYIVNVVNNNGEVVDLKIQKK